MSTFKSALPAPLQGVSQQDVSARLPGQVTAQTNMVSDPVTGMRRRPGLQYAKSWTWAGADTDHVMGWFTDLAGFRVHILVNTVTGNVRILDETFNEQASLTSLYLQNMNVTRIRGVACGDEFFLANCDIQPELQYQEVGSDPKNSGFFYIASGAFGIQYSVQLTHADGVINLTYTTPDGSSPGDAALAAPAYIAEQLANQLAAVGSGAVTDIRLVSWVFQNTTTAALQQNTGSAAVPVWVPISFGTEIPIANINQGYLRSVTETIRPTGRLQITYQVKAGGAWQTPLYVSENLRLPWEDGNPAEFVLPGTVFASAAPGSGDALLFVARDGPYVFLSRSGGISLSTNVASAYLITSRGGFVTSVGQLPARLPAAANGYTVRVGSGDSPQYYRYNHTAGEWLETAVYGSPYTVVGVPISIAWDGSAWYLNESPFEGRLAGDDKTNPAHRFMSKGITGIAQCQGRLVILAGPLVSLSASNKPRRFFRSTVTSLLSSDPVEIGSGMNSAAAYEWAVTFNKDLLLFSRSYQAVLPSGNQAVVPATATVVPTSNFAGDTTSCPITLGRTLMYCNPRSEAFFGVLEMIPSQYTDSQYISQDSTAHLPKYMGGRCRFAVSSSVASLALFGSTGDKTGVIVHEYHWNQNEKDQQAWHQWTMPHGIATAYFMGDLTVFVLIENGVTVLCTLDAKAGTADSVGVRRPFLDLYLPVTITEHKIALPSWLTTFDPDIAGDLTVVAADGAYAGEEIGVESFTSSELTTVLSWPSGNARLGLKFYSGMVPTPPQTTSYDGKVIHTDKATLLRFEVGVKNSVDFNTTISDDVIEADEFPGEVLTFSTQELQLGQSLVAREATIIIPARTRMRSTLLELFTQGVGELNLKFIEYVGKFNPKIRRK